MRRLLRDIGYFVILVLMVVGIGGAIYHAIGEGGWIDRLFGGVLHQGIASIIGLVLGLVLAGWFLRRWLIATQRNALFNDFLMYGMVALGILFIARLLVSGSL